MLLGQRLAQLGHTVLTGGYSGTMEAVSRGAAEAGGKVIGVTCTDIERAYRRTTNRWVQEEWKKDTLLERLEALILNCEAAMAMPGGPGTLTEIALAWNLMIVGGIPQRPLILIGEAWSLVFHEFFERLDSYIPAKQRHMLSFAADPLAAIGQLGLNDPPAKAHPARPPSRQRHL
jgi:predicted Rossmann-fold nucleotide-binding protein